ncbi:MAG TPA: long-chain fatty acid--CoA ligase [Kofleriaceae bacterium]|nr:long-chain fatty acid--CoA ligase [Kofleriaceae bacterium]
MTAITELTTLAEMARRSCETFADRPLFGTRAADGWTWTTYREVGDMIDRFRSALADLGIRAGDRIGIISRNRTEWAVAAYAAYGVRAALVPMYEQQRPDEWRFILHDSGARAVIVGDQRIRGEIEALRPTLPALEFVITLDGATGDPMSFASLLARGAEVLAPLAPQDPSDVAGFIYTSGTTGLPKGVILTHRNFMSNVAAVHQVFPLEPTDVSLSFLPWAHAYGQTIELHIMVSMGAATAFNRDVAHLLDDMADVKPTILVTVPRVFNRLHDRVMQQILERPALVQKLFRDGIEAAVRRSHSERVGVLRSLELALDDRLIFKKIRARFGGRLRLVISGAAALSREVAEFIDALGLEVYEGYGLSETSPLVACNTPTARRIGSVGKPIPGVEVAIDTTVPGAAPGEGEILVFGPNVMAGYHNRPEENAAVFTPDGGLRTGDLGRFDQDGFLYITGRIKEQYKLETGKYVMPAPLEEQLRLSPYIANVMLYGENRPFNVALVVPSRENIEAWARREHIAPAELAAATRALIATELRREAAEFKPYEVPRRFALLDEDFTAEKDLLTPTLKIKRRNVVALYRGLIETLYAEPAPRAAEEAAPPPPA